MDIDTRTDIYALGVILYELLVGSPPIDPKEFRRGAVLEMLRMVREVDPPRPSTKLSPLEDVETIAANRSVEPARLSSSLRGLCLASCSIALRSARPARRVPTAGLREFSMNLS